MWSQAFIALVVASGVGGFITSLSAVTYCAGARSLLCEGRFADGSPASAQGRSVGQSP
jgi:putative ABC transport system permease protein